MSCLTYCVKYIKNRIPRQILERFFVPVRYDQLRRDAFMPGNIDDQIIEKVINGIVRPDVDNEGATEVNVPLANLFPEKIDADKYLIHIPKEYTNGREIVSALSLVYYGVRSSAYSPYNNSVGSSIGGVPSQFYNNAGANNLKMMAMQGFANQTIAPETTNVSVVNGNTILVSDLIFPNQNSYLRCILSHDREFSTLTQPSWRHFAKLCELACKMYIYNQHIIDIDTAELVGGKELGKFKEIVEGYSDAGDLYDEYFREKWRKMAFMADNNRHTRYLKSLIGRFK